MADRLAETVPPSPPALPRMPRRSRAHRGLAHRRAPSAQEPPLGRRWGRVGAGATMALLGAWVFASLYLSAGDRVEVLALADDVERYETISRDHLRSVRVAADPVVETIDASEADDLVGRVAATDLAAGTLLAPGHLVDEGQRLVGADEALVGLELPEGATPVESLTAGSRLVVVLIPSASGGEADLRKVDAWLLDVGDVDDQRRTRHLDIVVPSFASAEVAAAAHDERIAIVLVGG